MTGNFATLAMKILHFRLVSLSWHTDQLPGKFAALLGDGQDQQAAVEWIQHTDRAWQIAETRRCQWWTAAVKRSNWRQLVVVKGLYLLKSVGFRVSTRTMNFVSELFSMIGQTKCVEDACTLSGGAKVMQIP